jgi:hypothetical protein
MRKDGGTLLERRKAGPNAPVRNALDVQCIAHSDKKRKQMIDAICQWM